MLWLFWLLGRGAGSFDGIDRDERHCEQLAGTSDILGPGLAGEQTVVADAMKALWQYMHQEAADFFKDTAPPEIYSLSLHDALPIPGPMSGGELLQDQPAVGDGDTMGVAGQ